MIKLIAVDVDGTLIDDNKRFCPDFWELLDLINKMGVHFVVASGRSAPSLNSKFPNAKNIYFIAGNGSYTHYGGECLMEIPIERSEADAIIRDAERITKAAIMYTLRDMQYIKNVKKEVLEEIAVYVPVYEIVDSFDGIKEPPLEITLFDENGTQQDCYNFLSSKNYPGSIAAITGFAWLDITNKDANKGNALRILMEKLNVQYDEAAAFGDNFNDIEMLKSVRYSYAMKNSPDIVKKTAKSITEKDNNEFGAVYEIKKLLGLM